jgi:hypothetical protein
VSEPDFCSNRPAIYAPASPVEILFHGVLTQNLLITKRKGNTDHVIEVVPGYE